MGSLKWVKTVLPPLYKGMAPVLDERKKKLSTVDNYFTLLPEPWHFLCRPSELQNSQLSDSECGLLSSHGLSALP